MFLAGLFFVGPSGLRYDLNLFLCYLEVVN
jgi:hypothetical protein